MKAGNLVAILIIANAAQSAAAAERVLDRELHHLRVGAEREWSDFPLKAERPSLTVRFAAARPNPAEWTLRLRQQDVRLIWKVLLNDKELGRLLGDENDTIVYLPIPAGRLVAGVNTLTIELVGKGTDDIRVGAIVLDDRPVDEALSEARVEIDVAEAGQAVPSRITVVNKDGALCTVGAKSNEQLAVRPGVIYTSTGNASFGLPAGQYTVYAGRGFAYGVDEAALDIKPGDVVRRKMTIRRVVPTEGWISCDTHVHTLTHSGHGDCTLAERMITVAGEGIELPIATDHNVQIDYEDVATKLRVRRYFTPVVGNEVTTPAGHFNIFPVPAGGPLPDYKLKDWKSIHAEIRGKTGARVMILNHPRDLHSGVRPFGPDRHVALSGQRLDGWEIFANAMEVVNSGAQQTDILRPFHDWFGLLNRGVFLTPVGASDSHDVSRFIIGQGRTYIRSRAKDLGAIDVNEAVENFLAGHVMVSCGLLTEITVNDKYGPGDLVPAPDQVKVSVRVFGPDWVSAEKIELYANGIKIREATIPAARDKSGARWQGAWILPRFRQDVHLVAIATGPPVKKLYWPIARPYQPTSIKPNCSVIGATGAVWIDADGDGKRTSAFTYAERLLKTHGAAKLTAALAEYDEAVAVQAASLLQAGGVMLDMAAAHRAGPQVERGFQAFAEAWRMSEIARQDGPKK